MRILFVSKPHFPAIGGSQRTTDELLVKLIERGHRAALFALESVHPEQRGETGPLPYALLRGSSLDSLPEELEGFGPDVVVAGAWDLSFDEITLAALGAARGVPVVLHLHDAASAELAGDLRHRAAGVIAVSAFVAEEATRHGVSATVVQPAMESAHWRVESTRRVALFVNPVPEKGVETVLALARARPDVPFAVALCWRLSPEERGDLSERARVLGNVEIRARTSDPARLYGDARLLLVPSIYPEAWGRVVPEAQASGIPALAADVGGLAESVAGGGLLVDARSGSGGWVDALTALWDDPDAYEQACSRAEQAGRRPELAPAAAAARFERDLLRAVAAGPVVEPARRRAASL